MKEEKKIWEKPSVQIGIGVLLYFLLRGGNTDHKVKTENKPIDIKGNDNEVTKGVRVDNISLVRIDPNFSFVRWFKDWEFFGKKTVEVPKESYDNWGKLVNNLGYVRAVFGKPILITKGYKYFQDGRTVAIYPQDKDHKGLWDAINGLIVMNPQLFKKVVRRKNYEIILSV